MVTAENARSVSCFHPGQLNVVRVINRAMTDTLDLLPELLNIRYTQHTCGCLFYKRELHFEYRLQTAGQKTAKKTPKKTGMWSANFR